MASRFFVRPALIACVALAALPAFAQTDTKAVLLKHLKTSRDFTLKVAEQMPDADFGFKLTAPQMSFAEQIVHLSMEQYGFLTPLGGSKPNAAKPASMTKKDVIAYARAAFDASIATVSKVTPEQLSKTYQGGEGTMTGLEYVMFLLDHTTHHRASAEMYLRAKGIKPADYDF